MTIIIIDNLSVNENICQGRREKNEKKNNLCNYDCINVIIIDKL